MSQMNSHRPDPVPVVEGSAIGIIPNPMSGRDIRRLTSQASVFPDTEKASRSCGSLAPWRPAGSSARSCQPIPSASPPECSSRSAECPVHGRLLTSVGQRLSS